VLVANRTLRETADLSVCYAYTLKKNISWKCFS
jgi:hypothetical protein